MSHPDDVAKLREIKRLLERIQRLPAIIGMPVHGLPGALPDRLPRGLRAGSPRPGAAALTLEPLEAGGAPPRHEPILPPLEVMRREARDLPPGEQPPQLPDREPPELPPSEAFELPLHRERQAPIEDSRALVPVRQQVPVGISPWVFIAATAVNTIVASLLAIVITLGLARREPAPAETDKISTALVRATSEPHAEAPPSPQPLELLPVGSASDPLQLEALKPTRLPLQVRPEDAAQESYILLLAGLPANVTLSGASRMGVDSWLLSPGALQRIEIVMPEWSASVFEVGVELRRTNGAVVAQSKMWLSVPPPAVPPGANLDETALKELIRNGDRLLNRGDVAAARALYERAAAMGSAQAAFALGSTYDQRKLWSLGVFGMVGDKERARQWYARADQLGHPDAKGRIAALRER